MKLSFYLSIAIFVMIVVSIIMGRATYNAAQENYALQRQLDSLHHHHDVLVDSAITDTYHTDSIQYILIHDLYEQLNKRK